MTIANCTCISSSQEAIDIGQENCRPKTYQCLTCDTAAFRLSGNRRNDAYYASVVNISRRFLKTVCTTE